MIKENIILAERLLNNFRYLIGVAIITLLIVLIFLTIQNFEKQNQIIETGGFINGKVKCVCNENAWNEYMYKDALRDSPLNNLNLSEINQSG